MGFHTIRAEVHGPDDHGLQALWLDAGVKYRSLLPSFPRPQPLHRPEPASNHIDIWFAPDTRYLPENGWWNLPDPEERERALSMRFDHDRQAFIQSREFLRSILSIYVRKDVNELWFDFGSAGKPFLRDHPALQFNISRREHAVIVAVSSQPVGIDIEYLRPVQNWREIADRWFAAEEYRALLADGTGVSDFLTIWTRKEALVKAIGTGLRPDVCRTATGHFSSRGWETVTLKSETGRTWRLRTLDRGPRWRMALATPLRAPNLHWTVI